MENFLKLIYKETILETKLNFKANFKYKVVILKVNNKDE